MSVFLMTNRKGNSIVVLKSFKFFKYSDIWNNRVVKYIKFGPCILAFVATFHDLIRFEFVQVRVALYLNFHVIKIKILKEVFK